MSVHLVNSIDVWIIWLWAHAITCCFRIRFCEDTLNWLTDMENKHSLKKELKKKNKTGYDTLTFEHHINLNSNLLLLLLLILFHIFFSSKFFDFQHIHLWEFVYLMLVEIGRTNEMSVCTLYNAEHCNVLPSFGCLPTLKSLHFFSVWFAPVKSSSPLESRKSSFRWLVFWSYGMIFTLARVRHNKWCIPHMSVYLWRELILRESTVRRVRPRPFRRLVVMMKTASPAHLTIGRSIFVAAL